MKVDPLTNYLSLRQFPGGPGWITRLEDACRGYVQAGTVITPADLESARQYCRGEIVEGTAQGESDWTLGIQPFDDVRFLFRYVADEEFGNALHFFVHQSARGQVATEDLAFMLDFYLQILGQQTLLNTLLSIIPEEQIPINQFPKMEIPFEDIQRMLFGLQHLCSEMNSILKLTRAAEFTHGSVEDEIGAECICRTLVVQPTANVILRFEFPTEKNHGARVTASEPLVYMPSNLVLYIVAAYANAFARAIGSSYRVYLSGLCHYFHVTKFGL